MSRVQFSYPAPTKPWRTQGFYVSGGWRKPCHSQSGTRLPIQLPIPSSLHSREIEDPGQGGLLVGNGHTGVTGSHLLGAVAHLGSQHNAVHTRVHHEGVERTAQDLGCDPDLNAGCFCRQGQRLVQGRRLTVSAAVRREDHALGQAAVLARHQVAPMVAQDLGHLRGQRYFTRVSGLGGAHLAIPHASLYQYAAVLLVNVLPLQGEEFARPHAGVGEDVHFGVAVRAVLFNIGHQMPQFIGRERALLAPGLGDGPRGLHPVRGVKRQSMFGAGIAHYGAQYPPPPLDRVPGVQTTVRHGDALSPGHPLLHVGTVQGVQVELTQRGQDVPAQVLGVVLGHSGPNPLCLGL
ncbi:MAG: hypothetical protein UT86_C0001G0231 [Candidatus Magasanikbacteria bacterium GW2011_GWC2_40_17]|uniref:Uncharacterized protein n=1 Tax=Candidatus Magasanikbacteria bacterium GW2011_GWA2_42_32 TaxID=1619039 RepID=A0A0G1CGB7_9BACT|nr:MAG: hypothetical protein UT86_C0001G0231 [Candidatus Magasanikbacteria bacterium GW2011_GWC2_40_17]KKS57591.1 MAG: hypothetical protein UV20_C0001G0231 [Candidatus Magasanikbacteria bacterium GW2011_GWA2_42_32]